MGKVIIQEYTTKNPITMIGHEAGVCWNGDITDDSKNYKRGLSCLEAEHGRTFEFPDVYMIIDGYSARTIREWYTHIGCLPSRLQESTRYVDCDNFTYVVPPSIKRNELAYNRYVELMNNIKEGYRDLINFGIPKEDTAMILPLGMTTKIVDKRNLRNLIDMSHQRICTRAYWEYRELFKDICKALSDYSEEWAYIVENYFKPKCKYMGYCKEKKSCGLMPKKDGE